jgi:hypothetical protein
MSTTTHVVEVKTKVSGSKQVDKLGTSIKKTGVQGAAAGTGIAAGFNSAKLAIYSAVPALKAFTVALFSTGIGAVIIALTALVGLFTKAGREGAEFGKAMSTLRAITSQTAEELKDLSNQAKQLGASTAFTASQVVSLQTELAKLGFTVQEIENSTPAILDLAASLDVNLAEAASFAGATLRGFGLDTIETQKLVDIFAKSTSQTSLDFEKLRESMKLVAPTARAVGLSVERTTALLGALANSNISGSLAGTGLSKVFIELSKKGIEFEDALNLINNSSNKLNTAIELVGINGGRSLLTLASTGGKALDQLEADFSSVEGAAKALADTRLDNLEGDITRLSSAWSGFLLGIEDGTGTISRLSRGAIQLLTNSISGFQDAVTFTTFYLREFWHDLKQRGSNAVVFAIGYFQKFGAEIKLFANKALLQLSEIPLIGRAIDKAVVRKNIDEAVKELTRAEELLERVRTEGEKRRVKKATRFERFIAEQKTEAKAKATKALESVDPEATLTDPETGETPDEKKARLLKEAFLKKLAAKEADELAITNEQKNELARERHLSELEQLTLETTEKAELIARINGIYDEKARLIKEENENLDAEATEKLRKKKVTDQVAASDAIIKLMGAETAAGKAAFIIRQGLLLKELAIEGKAALTKIALKNAEAGVDVSAGFIKTLKAGMPGNIPLLILYAAQAATLVSSMVKATQKAKAAIPSGGGGGGGSLSAPTAPTASEPPAFNIVGASASNQLGSILSAQSQTPIKTYVVAGDVSTGQALERNIIEGASIG